MRKPETPADVQAEDDTALPIAVPVPIAKSVPIEATVVPAEEVMNRVLLDKAPSFNVQPSKVLKNQ
jgi:hypothetical protein